MTDLGLSELSLTGNFKKTDCHLVIPFISMPTSIAHEIGFWGYEMDRSVLRKRTLLCFDIDRFIAQYSLFGNMIKNH